jgi:putative DNA primase/helicase
MREDPWSWIPTHKLVLFGQYKPTLKTVDGGMRRRTKLVPFAAKFEGAARDRELEPKLFAEAPGVLAWLVAGCVKWQAHGIPACKAVDVATGDYFREEDTVGQFFDGECVFTPDAKVTRKALHDAYVAWSKDRGDERPVSTKAFAQGVRDRGGVDRKVKTDGGPRDGWAGVRLLSPHEANAREQEQPELPGADLGRSTSATRPPQP